MDHYREIVPYYDELTKGYYDYSRLLQDMERLAPGKNILEVGMGTGTLSRLLAEEGFSVTGIDSSSPMIEKSRAKLKGSPVKIIHSDILDYQGSGFDMVLSHASVFVIIESAEGRVVESYLLEMEGVERALKNVYCSLKPAGIFVFDFYPEHDPDARKARFGEFEYDFELKERDGMWDFEKTHRIKKDGKVLATTTIRKIRIPFEKFCDIAMGVGFKEFRIEKPYVIFMN